MKIVELKASNVKRLRAVTIRPDGNLVVVGGKNTQGKSSTLDAIWMALGGAKAIPGEPVRRGTTKGEVTLDLGELTVRRSFSKKGTTSLTVTGADGAKLKSPQSVLDRLVGRFTFDPLGFLRMDRAKQAETLRELVGLDLSELDAQRQAAYDKRTEVNREVKRLEGAVKSMPFHEDAPDAVVSVAKLTSEIEQLMDQNAAVERKRVELNDARAAAVKQANKVQSLEEQLDAAREEHAKMVVAGKALAAEVAEMAVVDLTTHREQVAMAEETNAKVRANVERARAEEELEAKADEAATLSTKIEQIDGVRADAIAKAKYPVEGLGIDGDGVTFGGLPFEQASQAEQLKVSVAIGLALNPELRVLLIRDGSLLDSDSLAAVAAQAEAADSQLWLERVGEGEECSVILEDGAVKEAATNADRE